MTLGDADTAVTVTAAATVGGAATGLISLGDATINNGVTLTAGTGIANQIDLDAITGVGGGAVSNLTINTTGAVTVAEAVGTDMGTVTIIQSGGVAFQDTVNAGTVTLTDTTGLIDFQGNATINTALVTAAQDYNVSFTGGTNSIAGDTDFLNTGIVTLGNGGDTITFAGGLDTTSASSTATVGRAVMP